MSEPQIVNYFRVRMRIPFRDVDSWGLVWHGHYFSYVDYARIALLNQFGIPFTELATHGFVMPVVSVAMDLRAPGHADDAIAIDVAMLKARGAMADTHFKIVIDDGHENKVLARGKTQQVFTSNDGSLLYRIPLLCADGIDAMHAHALGSAP